MTNFKAYSIIIALLVIVGSGTIFFHYVEGWSWLDSYFFTVITISTVGYGDLVPVTPLGMIGATGFIFVGIGVFVLAIQQFAMFHMVKREKHIELLISRMGDMTKHEPLATVGNDQPQTRA